jgi:hypothetical protein
MAKGTKKEKEPRVIPGTSDYVVRENAARKQLGVAGLAARNKQLPKAARAFTKEMTGIDISRKGVSVDPTGLAMALPIGKVLKAAKALRAAGNIARADSLTARVVAKAVGGSKAAARGQREQKVVAFMRPDYPGVFQGSMDYSKIGRKGQLEIGRVGRTARGLSEISYPRRDYSPKFSSYPNTPKGTNISEGTMNIVDTRRMNPAQAKSALEGGVNQTATYKRGVPSTPKKVNKVTKRLLGGR